MSKKHKSVQPNYNSNRSISTLIDIVIPVYNRFDILELCLASIPKAFKDLQYNIVIVDNKSDPQEASVFYAKHSSEITLVRNPSNLGFPKACNIGSRRKASPLIFFLNSDVILDEGSGNILVTEMDDPTIGVVGMLLRFPEADLMGLRPDIRPPGKVQHVGLATNIRGEIIHPLISWGVTNPRVLRQREVLGVTGAAMMVRRSGFVKAKGFNEEYGLGTYEDIDLCLVMRDLGYNIIVNTGATATHFVGATVEKYKVGYPMNINRLIFGQRWSNRLPYTEWRHF